MITWDGVGDPKIADLKKWLKGHLTPILIQFDEVAVDTIFKDQNPAVILFDSNKDLDGTVYRTAFLQAAHSLRGEILFMASGVSTGV